MSLGAYVMYPRAFGFQMRTQSRKWLFGLCTAFESMFLSLKVIDCQSSNLSKALTAFEVKAVLSWKVGIMPFTFGIRFPFHFICYLAKGTFTLGCVSLHILRIPEPSSRWLCNQALHTDVCLSLRCVDYSVGKGRVWVGGVLHIVFSL